MKIPKIARALEHIDEDTVAAATKTHTKTAGKPKFQWVAIAACMALLLVAGSITVPLLIKNKAETEDGLYKDFTVRTEELAILWPWEDLSIYEKYSQIEVDGIKYESRGSTVAENLTDKYLGTYTATGFDEITETSHTADFEVYSLKDIDKSQLVAVKLDGSFCVFKNGKYTPPRSLGELFEAIPMEKHIELKRFSENGDGPDNAHYALNDDGYIWQVLKDCGSAVFVEDEEWSAVGRDYIGFSLSSDAIGIYKRAMYITADGYLWTNAFDWGYIFNIGKDAASKIIKYAKENSVKVAYEPFMNSVVGAIVEITEEYILVDDSILYNEPKNGRTYKVPLDSIAISRYIKGGIIEKGDFVKLEYRGKIDKDGLVISYPVSISKATITVNGETLVFE